MSPTSLHESLASAVQAIGVSPAECVRLVGALHEDVRTQQPLAAWKEQLRKRGIPCERDELERYVVRLAAEDSLPRIDALPVHVAVRKLLRKELERYLKPPADSDPLMTIGSYPFAVAFKMASLRRFPAGPLDWDIGGIPRSKLLTIRPPHLPRALRFIFAKFGGIRPAFYVYVAPPPRKRALVMDTEVRRAYYRMAKSLELQPAILGLMTISWLHDPVMLARMPQLTVINEPFVSHGGFVAPAGLAPPDSGFLERSPEREKQYKSGELRPRLALALWPREAAIAWAASNPQLE